MKRAVLITAALMATASPAYAATIVGLYNTGVDNNGNKLAVGAIDPHYTVNGNSPYVTDNALYYQSPNAGFISAQPNGNGNSQAYSITFDLTDTLNAQLSGNVAYDNGVIVQLNGHVIYSDVPAYPGSLTAFGSLHSFSSSAVNFKTGSNLLQFTVIDYSPPTGLLVTDLAGTTGAVPEPATWAMMVMGFGMIGFGLRSRRKQAVRVTYA